MNPRGHPRVALTDSRDPRLETPQPFGLSNPSVRMHTFVGKVTR